MQSYYFTHFWMHFWQLTELHQSHLKKIGTEKYHPLSRSPNTLARL